MKIIGFAEGAWGEYPGIVSTPTILGSTAALGHNAVLVMGGRVIPGRERFVVPDSESALQRKEKNGTFGIVCIPAWTRWAINPAMFWRFSRLVRDADFVSLHSLYSFPVLAGFLLARFHRKPYGVWPHGVLAPFQRRISARKKWVHNKLFADRILRNASVIFFSATGEREETADLGFNTPSVIIPDGFDADEFSVLPERGRFRDRFFKGHTGPLVLFLARLAPKKGLDLLAKIMQRVIAQRPDVRLAIVGPPDPASFNEQVVQWVKESGIERQTVMTGGAGPQMRLEAFADADVYVLPSHEENFGFSVFEAMACGIPVVVSETLNYAAEIARNGAGFALPRSPEEFSSAIVSLIDQPEQRRKMGSDGRLLARQYPLEDTGAKVAKTVECILHRRPFSNDLAGIADIGARS